jgi:Transcription factor zinc-finger
MNCPRCIKRLGGHDGPYRGQGVQELPVELVPDPRESGVVALLCRSCGGAFVTNEDLVRVENHARNLDRRVSPREVAMRAYAPATTAITCPSCGEETTRRQWGIGTLVYVDVCIECRGVWLDVGELDQLEGRPPR